MIRKIVIFVSVLFFIVSFSSCSRFKDITYLRGVGYNTSDSLIKTTYSIYKVQAFDILYVKVNSIDEEASRMFNRNIDISSSTTMSTIMGPSLIGYTVDINGFIDLPVIGKLFVSGQTIYEIEHQLREKIKNYLADAQVSVRLLGFKVTLLGEIGSGPKTITADRANILEVFAMGGDINKYGNKRKVLLLRTTPEGVRTYRIDVTKDDLISSPYFYVQPNDLIYVEPIKSAAFRLSLSDYALFLSTITATISTIFLIQSINK